MKFQDAESLQERFQRAVQQDLTSAEGMLEQAVREGCLEQISEESLYVVAQRVHLRTSIRQCLLDHLWLRLPAEKLLPFLALTAGCGVDPPRLLRPIVECYSSSRSWALEVASSWGFLPRQLGPKMSQTPLRFLLEHPEFGSHLTPPGSTSEDLQRWKSHLARTDLVPHPLASGQQLSRVDLQVLVLEAPSPTEFSSKAYVRSLVEEVRAFFERELGCEFRLSLKRLSHRPDTLPVRGLDAELWVANMAELIPRVLPWKPRPGQVRLILTDESEDRLWTYGLRLHSGSTIAVRMGAWRQYHAFAVAHELGHELLGLEDVAVTHPLEHAFSLMGYEWKGPLSLTSMGYRYRASCLHSREDLEVLSQAGELRRQGRDEAAARLAGDLWHNTCDFLPPALLAIRAWTKLARPRRALAIAREVMSRFPSETTSRRLRSILGPRFRCPLNKEGTPTMLDRRRRVAIAGHAASPDRLRELIGPTQMREPHCLQALSFSLLNAGKLEGAYEAAVLRAEIAPFDYRSWVCLLQISVLTGRGQSADALYRICRSWRYKVGEDRAYWLLARERTAPLLKMLVGSYLIRSNAWWFIYAVRLLIRGGRIDEARALLGRYPKHLSPQSYEARWLRGEPLWKLRESLVRRSASFLGRMEALEWLAFLDPGGPWLKRRQALAPCWPGQLVQFPLEHRPSAPLPWHPKAPGIWPRFAASNRPLTSVRPPIILEVGARLLGLAYSSWQQPSIRRALRVLQDRLGQPPSTFRLTLFQGAETGYQIQVPQREPLQWNFKAPGLIMGPFDAMKGLRLATGREPLYQLPIAWTHSPSKGDGLGSGLVSFWAWEVLLIQLGLLCLPGRPDCADSDWQRWLSMKELLGFAAAEAG